MLMIHHGAGFVKSKAQVKHTKTEDKQPRFRKKSPGIDGLPRLVL